MTDGERLRFAREEMGLTRRALAYRLGRPESSIRAMEADTFKPAPDLLEWVERMAAMHRENPPPGKGAGNV
jgi:ribosome-binding protein aMBF1 (putative translation factor)